MKDCGCMGFEPIFAGERPILVEPDYHEETHLLAAFRDLRDSSRAFFRELWRGTGRRLILSIKEFGRWLVITRIKPQ